jgi:hypothetical protein
MRRHVWSAITPHVPKAAGGAGESSQLPGHGSRILLIEDEPKVADAVSAGLRAEGYDVVQERKKQVTSSRLTT